MCESKTILLVEDNPDDIELTLLAFEQSQLEYHVVVVQNGAEALDYLFSTGAYAGHDPVDLPKLILLDLQLPQIDGLTVLQRLRQNELTRRLPIVILTNSNEKPDLLNSYNFGCNSYIQKPVDYNQFLTVLNEIWQYWLVYNASPPLNLA